MNIRFSVGSPGLGGPSRADHHRLVLSPFHVTRPAVVEAKSLNVVARLVVAIRHLINFCLQSRGNQDVVGLLNVAGMGAERVFNSLQMATDLPVEISVTGRVALLSLRCIYLEQVVSTLITAVSVGLGLSLFQLRVWFKIVSDSLLQLSWG